ncbi:MAG: WG repeat-containing protein [Bacteroidota bacterium]
MKVKHPISSTNYKLRMHFFTRAYLLSLFLIFSSFACHAGDIDKAFKYLNTGDYPNANKYLREVLVDEPGNAAANYGMAKYFSSKDNKDYHLDSANVYIKRAADKIPFSADDKQSKKFLALGVRDFTIQSLMKSINFEAYSVAEQQNTLESYQHFVDQYTEKAYVDQAVNFRNQKAFIKALSLNHPDALAEFIRKYPDATDAKEAKEKYEKMVYEQTTADKTFQSYKKYLDTYPDGAYVKEAKKNYEDKVFEYYAAKKSLASWIEFAQNHKDHPAYNNIQDSIYKLAIKEGTVDAYKNFVRNYSSNRNLNYAWDQLYLLSTSDAAEASFQNFRNEFPDYPNQAKLTKDLELSKKDLKPFQQGDKWGFAWQQGSDALEVVIPFEYEEAFEFKNGYAAVRKKPCTDEKCTYFYIDKNNERVFDTDFNFAGDFNNGYAVVGIGNCETEECKYGVINKLGSFTVAAEYDELEEPSNGLYLAGMEGRFGFINQSGQEVVTLKYTDALPFSEGVAAVAIDSYWFFIDTLGKQLFLHVYRDASSFKEGLCAVTQNHEEWGYIDMNGNFVMEPAFETAEDFETDFAIVSKKEKDPKNKGLFTSQRYKIDRSGKIVEKLTAPKQPSKNPGRKKRGK